MKAEEFIKFSMKAFGFGYRVAEYMDDYDEDETKEAVESWKSFLTAEATDPELELVAMSSFHEGFVEKMQSFCYEGGPDYDEAEIARLSKKYRG